MEMIFSSIISIVYFYFGCGILHHKLKNMYKILNNNKLLIAEKRKVVQVFPHSVLILPKESDEVFQCYSNNEFESQIRNIHNKIDELSNIEVSLKKSNSNKQSGEEFLNLLTYLKKQQESIDDDKIVAPRQNIIIDCSSQKKYESTKSNEF